ncbi:MAG: flagellin, partial [Acetivibrio sp.]
MKINHNIAALVANGHLKTTNSASDKSLERLSSGYRINRAADDAAGMAISQKMKMQIAGLNQASRNASDGISVIQTAEGALGEVESMLQRGRELAVQAANGTNTAEDREAIQKEISQLMAEVDRISTDTEFNTKTLLNGDIDRKSYSNNTKFNLISATDQVESKHYNIQVGELGSKAEIQGTANTMGTVITADLVGSITLNGETITIKEGDTREVVTEKIRDITERIGGKLSINGNTTYKFETKGSGVSQHLEIHCDNAELAKALGIPADAKAIGKDTKVRLDPPPGDKTFSDTATVIVDGNLMTITDNDGFEMKIEIADSLVLTDKNGDGFPDPVDAKITVLEAGPMVLQIGANEGQTVSVSIPEVSAKTLGLEKLNVLTRDEASKGVTLLDKAINNVSN